MPVFLDARNHDGKHGSDQTDGTRNKVTPPNREGAGEESGRKKPNGSQQEPITEGRPEASGRDHDLAE